MAQDDALRALNKYVMAHTAKYPPKTSLPLLIDMHFFKVLIDESFDKAEFRRLFNDFVSDGYGEFAAVDMKRIKGGPSYIEWAGWIGDQGLAMQLMAAGQYAGLWDVITPEKLSVTGEQADEMAGRGYVMTSGLNVVEEDS